MGVLGVALLLLLLLLFGVVDGKGVVAFVGGLYVGLAFDAVGEVACVYLTLRFGHVDGCPNGVGTF
jgi:hypothetical protein